MEWSSRHSFGTYVAFFQEHVIYEIPMNIEDRQKKKKEGEFVIIQLILIWMAK